MNTAASNAASNTGERRRATLVGAGAVFLWGSLAVLTTLTGEIQPFQIVATAFFVAFISPSSNGSPGENP
jgi:hypothetical protein